MCNDCSVFISRRKGLHDFNMQCFPAGPDLPKRPPCRGLWAGTAAPAPGSSPTVPSLRPAAATSRAASAPGHRRTEAGPASPPGRSGTRPATTVFSWTNWGKPSHHESCLATTRAGKKENKNQKHNTTSACPVNSHLINDNPEESPGKHAAVKR